MMTPQGLLFDFDGTLADTMEGHFGAWKTALMEFGITITSSDYYPLEGKGLHEVARIFTSRLRWTEGAIDELVLLKKKLYVQQSSISFYPGVESLVTELRDNKVPMAIVTAGHLDQLKLSVPQSFLDNFDALITGDITLKSKPNPEPYLQGAESLRLRPDECIAVESAPLGVESAQRAGIYCMAVCFTVGQDELSKADEIVDCFNELRGSPKIKQILGGRKSHAVI
jgi:beta-phosphoglucomutase